MSQTCKQCKSRTLNTKDNRTQGKKGREAPRGTCDDGTGIRSRRDHKLDCLKSESKGAVNDAPTCVVPSHAPQTNSLWRGVGEVGSACEVGWRRRVQPRPFLKTCQGVGGRGKWDCVE